MGYQNDRVRVSGGGLSLPGLLGIVFIVLKLTGVITWSWWWVLAPFWVIPAAALALLLIGALLIGVIAVILVALDKGKKNGPHRKEFFSWMEQKTAEKKLKKNQKNDARTFARFVNNGN